jgi:hypothetical protein
MIAYTAQCFRSHILEMNFKNYDMIEKQSKFINYG